MSIDPATVAWAADTGLVPAIVQDRADGRVLMLAWVDQEALAATLATGDVHFHSRSRDRLWRKGETSGNVMRLASIELDCDSDALLLAVDPVGPTCHRGTRSCFDPADASWADAPLADARLAAASPNVGASPAGQGFAWLETLWTTIASRAAERPAGSYTTSLLDGGVDAAGRKVTEEATEVLLAAKDDAVAEAAGQSRTATRAALGGEAADLLFHVLVLLAERGLEPARVIDVLKLRHRPAS
ncbi:MAG TPA: bifunctional phosphoribosyl-AMP cyclohydrolase/phosphoribosyl-ATP diphosphatase HisIE [Candidatus Limnocylindrales bacterium]|nr:bifunctional phosphoribosyl-AMP cyclohydrolase/phosphoribosyl-ATP diphosphatase HisIE [Candidatus Limnocylindrales bacterium]